MHENTLTMEQTIWLMKGYMSLFGAMTFKLEIVIPITTLIFLTKVIHNFTISL